MDISIEHLVNCPITQHAIHVVQDIYSPNLSSLKGKTVYWSLPHLPSGVDPIPPDVLERHPSVTIVMDILFTNNIPLLLSMSRGLKFMTIEALPNRQIKTIKDKVTTICTLYWDRSIGMESIFVDAEFEPLRPDVLFLNMSDADDHQPIIEQAIRIVKDRIHSTYRMLPFKYIPHLMVIHLVRNSVFWLNAFISNDSWSSKHLP